ncbi:MAG TPA: xylulokinase [Crinalium sp.]|jgi:xylulokinase
MTNPKKLTEQNMLLGIDLGTGSVKVLLLSVDGQVLAEASSAYPVRSPHPGWAETDPMDWWNAVAIAIHQLPEQERSQVQAIGLSGQMHGVVLAAESGEPLYPAILWADTRSSGVLDRYQVLTAEQQQRLANPITAGMAGSTLLWVKQYNSALYADARWMLQPKDWLRLKLTGTVATEPSDASGTLLYDVLADDWAYEVLEALHLRTDWLPSVVPSSQIAGALIPDVANQLGLPTHVPVVAGASDTAAAALGSRLLQPGLIQLTVGSGAQIITLQSQPVVEPQRRTHLFRSALPDQWYTLAAIQNAGLALEWVRSMLGLTWAEVYAEAFQVPMGCDGLTFLPYLTGDRTPHLNPHARGAWVGLSLHHTRAHLMRSALEGVAFSLRQGLDIVWQTMPSADLQPIRLAGGGTQEKRWQQLIADILQVPLWPIEVPAASARGAAILAGLGTGLYSSAEAGPQVLGSSEGLVTPNPSHAELERAWQTIDALYAPIFGFS